MDATASPAPSPLLRDILRGEPGAGLEPGVSPAAADPAPPISQKLSVGVSLAARKQRVVEMAAQLRPLAGGETQDLLKSIIEDLERRVCQIAVVGQMNAGKSSLINVLVEQAELLPADINPWTTVVTKIHFGVPGAPATGASFSFFTLDEWRRLSIGGKTRELTERIFPDFDWSALNEQVQIMQRRAEQKLGARFQTLLGTEHSYPAITPGLLNRYVGAGLAEPGVHAEAAEGEFSDITKIANVFFDLGAFNFPTILIDTPGVNDPFLVRDEITRQNLDAVDICVIVLTARQPLSTADLNLLRMLRGLNKSRLIIFINKIDEIEGGEAVLDEVARRVSAVLQEEFPSTPIPVIYGSALWARKALFPGAPEVDELAAASPAGNAEGFLSNVEMPDWLSHSEIAGAMIGRNFFQKSGLPSLALTISELMQDGPVAGAIEWAKTYLDAASHNLMACLEIERSILSRALENLDGANQAVSRLEALNASLTAEFNRFYESLVQIYKDKIAALHQILTGTVQNYLHQELTSSSPNAGVLQASQADFALRLKLEEPFLEAFEDAANSVLLEQDRLIGELSRLLQESGIAERLTTGPAGKLPLGARPSLGALSEPAALGMAARFVERAASPLEREEQGPYISRLISADFEPIVEKLTADAAKALNDLMGSLLQRLMTLTLRPLETSAATLSSLLSDGGGSSNDAASFPSLLEQEIEKRNAALADLRLIIGSG